MGVSDFERDRKRNRKIRRERDMDVGEVNNLQGKKNKRIREEEKKK